MDWVEIFWWKFDGEKQSENEGFYKRFPECFLRLTNANGKFLKFSVTAKTKEGVWTCIECVQLAVFSDRTKKDER